MSRINVALSLLLLLSIGCGGAPTEPSDFEFGRIDVYVRDTDAQLVNGVQVRLDRRSGGVEDPGGATGTVGPAGYYFFLKTTGEFRIVITPPAGFVLGPNQSASVDVEFAKNQTKTVNFVVRKV
ncbi:MAG TPA: hypothetical protein VE010_12735 [Thermoanaerobaculia bacterium]|nr:hypothetical protein [Thermoanaerobaculia bacterium]